MKVAILQRPPCTRHGRAENDRVDVDRDGVLGQCLLSVEGVVWMRSSITAVTLSITGKIHEETRPLRFLRFGRPWTGATL